MCEYIGLRGEKVSSYFPVAIYWEIQNKEIFSQLNIIENLIKLLMALMYCNAATFGLNKILQYVMNNGKNCKPIHKWQPEAFIRYVINKKGSPIIHVNTSYIINT